MTTIGHDAPLMLSVSGARGIVGRTMTPDVARRFARCFGAVLIETCGTSSPLVVMGRDSRPSGAELAAAAASGLVEAGCRVVDLGIVMTPTAGVMIDELNADGGMVVTASHNPGQWNGLKCLNADGVAPPAVEAARLIHRFKAMPAAPPSGPCEIAPPIARHDGAAARHVARVLDLLGEASIHAIRRRAFRVVVDSVRGAGGPAAAMLLRELGCAVIHLYGEPTGDFPHAPEPLEENLRELAATVNREHADIGFAQDPDADRLAIIDETGRYIGEEYTLALCARRVLERFAADPSFAHGSGEGAVDDSKHVLVLAANMSTSRMIDDIAASFPGLHVSVLRTAVGEANVVAAMKPHGDRAVLGGEGNGGVIVPRLCWVRDSLSSMALVLDLLAGCGGKENGGAGVSGAGVPPVSSLTLSSIVASLPRYEMIKRKFDLASVGGSAAVGPALTRVREAFHGERFNDTDGVRLDFDDGWIHLRPSNTEPIIRLIAEATTHARAEELIESVRAAAHL